MKARLLIACTTLSFALAACGGTVASGSASPTATAGPTASSAASSTTTASTTKVSANNATQAELLAALTAAGAPNPSNCVREVLEYRRYPTNDPTFVKLRGQLAIQPGSRRVDKIVSALSLP
jgi:DNA uptake protein ComE-like DNA-binding protein